MLVERARDAEAGRALLDQEDRDRLRRLGREVGLGGDAIEIGMDAIGDVDLGAVQHVAVALAPGGGADALHIGAGVRLGHGDRDDLLARDDGGHELVALRLAAAIGDMDRCHVGVDERRDREAREGRAAELLGQHHGRHRVELGATIFGGVADAEEAELAHAPEHLARHEALLFPGMGMGLDLSLDEAAQLVAQRLVLLPEIGRAAGALACELFDCRHGDLRT